MTHAEALAKHRGALDHRPDCHRQLLEFGPAADVPGCTAWVCSACQLVLAIDPTGVIRDRRPLRDGRE